MCERVRNGYIAGTAQKTELQIAHEASRIVNILRSKKDGCLIVNALSAAIVRECYQQRTSPASWIYKDAVFDTNRKSLLRHISAEKGLK